VIIAIPEVPTLNMNALAALLAALTLVAIITLSMGVIAGPAVLAINPLVLMIALMVLVIAAILAHAANEWTRARQRLKLARREAEELASKLRLTRDEIILPKPIRVRLGKLTALGIWITRQTTVPTGKTMMTTTSRHYKHKSAFLPAGPAETARSIRLSELPRGFTVFSGPHMDYVELPAVKLEPDGGHGREMPLILAMLDPISTEFAQTGLGLTARHKEDRASASVRLGPDALEGTITWSASKARGVRLELEGELSVKVGGLEGVNRAKIELAYARKSLSSFKYEFPLRERTFLLTVEDASPRYLLERLGLETPVLLGFSKGRYKLSLVLDLPLRPDVKASVELPVKHPS